MSYQHEHVPIYTSDIGFSLLAHTYKSYHKALDTKESGGYEKYLPRSLTGKHILDLGAGDGRIAKKFLGRGFASYTSVDIAADLLQQGPSRTQKIVADISKPLKVNENNFDLIFVFHCLLHLQNIAPVFENIAQYLAPGGVCLIVHHNERRPILYEVNDKSFKIASFFHSDAEIHSCAKTLGLSLIEHPMNDTCFFILSHG